jgi:hypothetical protein
MLSRYKKVLFIFLYKIEQDNPNELNYSFDQPLTSFVHKKSNSIIMKKLNQNIRHNHYGTGVNESDSSTRPIGQAISSMPRLTNTKGVFNSGNAVRDGVIDINATYDLIQKLHCESSEYEGGNNADNRVAKKNSRSQNRSKVKLIILQP